MDEDDSQWIRPRENTVEALVYGMNECDGVELDLRLSEDNRLVLHHAVSYTHLTLPTILRV